MAYNLPFYSRLIKSNPNDINLKELTSKAKRVSDDLPDWESYGDDENTPTDRERAENDVS